MIDPPLTTTQLESRLAALGRWVLILHREECADIDGCSIHEKAIELGLLVQKSVTESCGENCACAEWADEWPQQCTYLQEGIYP